MRGQAEAIPKFFQGITKEWQALVAPPPRFAVLVALSGGVDSLLLLHYFLWLRERQGIFLAAAHFNHNLRPSADKVEEEALAELCRKYDLPLFLGEADVKAQAQLRKTGLEDAARTLRYDFLLKARLGVAAEQTLPTYLALGQHQDDQAETLLLALSRGTGLRGLCGMRMLEGEKLRPFLHQQKADLLAMAELLGFNWYEDATNRETTYLRNRLRLKLLPYWQELVGKDMAQLLGRTASNLQADDAYLSKQAQTVLPSVLLPSSALNLKRLCQFDEVIIRRVLLHWLELKELEVSLSQERFQALISLMRKLPQNKILELTAPYYLHIRDWTLALELRT